MKPQSIMFWLVSRLILRIWYNRIKVVLSKYPSLWLVVILLPVIYVSGSSLFYIATSQVFEFIPERTTSFPRLQQVTTFSLFSSFFLLAFLLLSLLITTAPNETTFQRLLAPLPVNDYQRVIGLLLPGILIFLMAQMAVWTPVFIAFFQKLHIPLWQLSITVLLGLACCITCSLSLYQAAFYGASRLLGAKRSGLRHSVIPLGMVIGICAIAFTTTVGSQALTTSIQPPTWLWFYPTFWMTQALSSNPGNSTLGISLLLLATFLSSYTHRYLLYATAGLIDGTRGNWVPLRCLPLRHSSWLTCCIYEVKAISRDLQVIIGQTLLISLIAAVCGLAIWLMHQGNTVIVEPLVHITASMSAVAMCAVAHMSWGRDVAQRQLFAITPLAPHILLTGKIIANLVAITIMWLIPITVIVLITKQTTIFGAFWLLPVGAVAAFLFGVVVPFSPNDPLSIFVATGIFLIFGLPAQLIIQELVGFIQSLFILPDYFHQVLSWISYIALIGVCYFSTLHIDAIRWQEAYE